MATVSLKSVLKYRDTYYAPFLRDEKNTAPASVGYAGNFPFVEYLEKKGRNLEKHRMKTQKSFEKISPKHGRSMTEKITSKKLVWGGDLPGDIYGAVTIKGTSMEEDVVIERTDLFGGEYRGYGLMDDSSIDRVTRASEILRAHGLPTEKPVNVKKIKEVYIKRNESRLFDKYTIGNWEKKESEEHKRSLRKKGLQKYLDDYDFIALERHVQTDERLTDVEWNEKNFTGFLKPIFKWLNVATAYKNSGLIAGTPRPEAFDMSKRSLRRYFMGYLPSQMGVYLGRLHKLGLTHGCAHAQNWSMVGTLYDLDSITGKRLFRDDRRSSQGGYADDFYCAVEVLTDKLPRILGLSGLKDRKKLLEDALFTLADYYLKERFGKGNFFSISALRFHFMLKSDETEDAIMSPVWDRLIISKKD